MAPVLEGYDVVSIGVVSDIPGVTGKSLLRNFIFFERSIQYSLLQICGLYGKVVIFPLGI